MTTLCTASAVSTAPPGAFFERWADMDSWPEWDEAIAWTRLDGPFAAGSTGTLKPKGGPKVSFVIETLEPDSEFTDVSSMPGAKLRIRHLVAVQDDDRTRVDIAVSIDGPLGWLWGRILGKGIAASTPDGLRHLVAMAEADAASDG